MKILIVHNRYKTSAPSGENIYVDKEVFALKSLGYEVETCYIENDDLKYGIFSYVVVLFELLLPIISFIIVFRADRSFKPDIIHFHNTFPRIGWLSLRYFARKAFLTVHNYRLFCANGVALRADNVCILCSDHGNLWSTMRYKCYRNSYLSTLAVKIYIALIKRFGKLEAFQGIFCFSDYQKKLILTFHPDLSPVIKIKNNIHEFGKNLRPNRIKSKPIALFVGRFSVEKGIHDLVQCILTYPDMFKEVHFVGGTISDLRNLGCEDIQVLQNVKVHGKVSHADVKDYLKHCDLLLVPSTCLEGQPTVVFEALEQGCLPVVSTVPTLVDLSTKLGLKCVIDFTDHKNFYDNYVRMLDAYHNDLELIAGNLSSAQKLFALTLDFYEENIRF